MGIDEELLNRNNQTSADKAGNLNRARRAPVDINNSPESSFNFNTVRHQAQLNKLRMDRKKGAATSALVSPIKKGTNSLLRQAWLNLIDSFGSTLFWINIHAFLHQVLGDKLFGKLGGEWTDTPGMPAGSKKPASGKMLKTVEPMGLGCLDIGCLLTIVFVFVLIAIIINVVANPIPALAALIKVIVSKLFGAP